MQEKYNFNSLNKLKIKDKKIHLNESVIDNLKDVSIKSDADNISEVTITFYAKVEGLDY